MANLIFAVAFACGVVAAVPLNNRIIGGKDAPDGAFPYVVSLRNITNNHMGTGSIISDSWLLTTAVTAIYGNLSMIVAGTNHLSSNGTTYKISELIAHPNFSTYPYQNDIGLIKVDDRINFNPKVKAVKLPSSPPANGTAVTVAGWGYTNLENKTKPDKLQYMNVTILDNEKCRSIFNTSICTIGPIGIGMCIGDNGDPVVSNNVVFGLAAWLAPCARGEPDGHTNVALYTDWIRKTTGI